MGLAPVLGSDLDRGFVGVFFCHFSFGGVSGFLLVGLVLGRCLCERGEQRVLVAAPRFALYVARNKHPLLAFWYEWMGACLPMARYLDFFHVCPRDPFSLSSLLLCPVFLCGTCC